MGLGSLMYCALDPGSPAGYLYHVVEQGDPRAGGFGLRQLEQSTDLKASCVPCMAALRGEGGGGSD